MVNQKNRYIGDDLGGDMVGSDAPVVARSIHINNRHMEITLNPTNTTLDADPYQLRRAYLKHLYEETKYISLQNFAMEELDKSQSLVELGAIYTALETREVERDDELDRSDRLDMRHMKQQRMLSALEVANQEDRLVLLGDPGSGKSTFIRFLALCMTGELLGKKEVNLSHFVGPGPYDEAKDTICWDHGPLLPVFIPLRDFAVKALPAPGSKGSAYHVWSYIDQCLEDWGLSAYAESLRRDMLHANTSTLVLLDSLDEVLNPENQHRQIKEALEDFAKSVSSRIIVTSRTYAYQKQDLAGFVPIGLAPFHETQIRSFIDRWYGYQTLAKQREKDDVQGRAKLLQEAVFERNHCLQDLAKCPLLLTLMAVLHSWHGRDLLERRVDIYEQILGLLVRPWSSRTGLRRLLEQLAFDAYARSQSEQDCTHVYKKDLSYGLTQICNDRSAYPNILEEHVNDHMGILIKRGEELFTFPHRTLQEYLAACYLTNNGFPKQISDLARRNPQRWREVAQLVGLRVNITYSILALATCLSGRDWQAPDAWGTLIAGECLVESECFQQFDEFEKGQFETFRTRLAQVLAQPFLPAVERTLAGRLLAQLGDPRDEVMTPEAMAFHEIPPGPFWMGAAEQDKLARDNEKPGFENYLDYSYYMARHPVSNSQYRSFVEAGGYAESRYWPEAVAYGRWKDGKIINVQTYNRKELEWDTGKLSGPADYGLPFYLDNHPIVGVSWYEAMAYCRWLTEFFQTTEKAPAWLRKLLNEDWRIILPSEAEWEKAARGPGCDQRIYPWGCDADSEKMNYDRKIGFTSALGCFTQGKSPFECEDMSGNVWEWCRTPWQESYKEYENEKRSDSKESLRVLRGGAFYLTSRFLYCSYRNWFNPYYRSYNLGFRVCVCPPFL